MDGIQPEGGYTQVSNELILRLANSKYPISKLDLGVIFTIIRFTIGYHRRQAGLSVSFISSFLKADRAHVSRSINYLISSNVIEVITPEKGTRSRELKINTNCSEWHFKRKPRSG